MLRTRVLDGRGANHTSSNASCYEFNEEQIDAVIIALVTISVLAVIMCFLAILVIGTLKLYRLFLYRLILYLMIAGFFHAISIGLQVLPVHHEGRTVAVRSGQDGWCKSIGFIAHIMEWTFMLLFTWITAYLFILAVFKYKANKKKHEIAGIIFAVVFPLTFNWIPFLQDMYGLAGLWCWIRTTNADCTHDYALGITYQFTLFYGPLVALILFSFVAFVVIIVRLFKEKLNRTTGTALYQHALKEALPLLIYPLVFDIICSLMILNRVYYSITVAHGGKPFYPLWFVQGVAMPLRELFPPVAFLLHPNTLRKIFCSRREADQDVTAYVVSQEYPYTDEDPLIIKSATDDLLINKSYMSLFDGSGSYQWMGIAT